MGRVRGTHGEDKYMYAFGKKKLRGKKLIEIPRRRWDDNIKTDLKNRMTGNEMDSFVSGEKQVAVFVNRAMNPFL
jgi:hypothetical protein